jgi:hypothetical protein
MLAQVRRNFQGTWFEEYYNLNPLVGIIDGFRWCLLEDKSYFNPQSLYSTVIISFSILALSLIYFRRKENTFVDHIWKAFGHACKCSWENRQNISLTGCRIKNPLEIQRSEWQFRQAFDKGTSISYWSQKKGRFLRRRKLIKTSKPLYMTSNRKPIKHR